MTEEDLHWLAGLLEGEGSFLKGPPSAPHQPRITLTMTDEDVIQKVAAFWSVKYHTAGKGRCLRNGWMPAFAVCIKGSRAVTLMEQLRPLMGKRRQAQIANAVACYHVLAHPTTRLDISKVKEIKHRLRNGASVKQLAEDFQVTASTIYHVKNAENWGWVTTE